MALYPVLTYLSGWTVRSHVHATEKVTGSVLYILSLPTYSLILTVIWHFHSQISS